VIQQNKEELEKLTINNYQLTINNGTSVIFFDGLTIKF